MKWLLLAAALTLSVQQPQTEPNYHDTLKPGDPEYNVNPNETRIPPGHYCVSRVVFEENQRRAHGRSTNAHPCDCKMVCHFNEQGEQVESEESGCLAYCHVNNRKCTCHTEEPCPGAHPDATAYRDMDGTIVAVLR